MSNNNITTDSMRKTAEMIVEAQKPNQIAVISPERAQFLLQELQVHQIELQMQNEELRRSHDELEEAKERYFDLYELAPIGYLTLNKDGKILEANLTATTLFAIPRGSLINSPLTTFIVPEDQDTFYHHTHELITSSEGKSCELRFVRGNELFWALLNSSTVLGASGNLIWHLTLSDITEQKKLQEDLIIAKDAAEFATKTKSEFMSNMSRDIRTSLNGVLGLTDLVLESKLEPLQHEYLTKSKLAAHKLLTSLEREVE
jgi:PAS domain S-box-containing protein